MEKDSEFLQLVIKVIDQLVIAVRNGKENTQVQFEGKVKSILGNAHAFSLSPDVGSYPFCPECLHLYDGESCGICGHVV